MRELSKCFLFIDDANLMEHINKENFTLAACIAGLIALAALFITATLALGEMIFKGIKALVLHGYIDASKFSLLLVAGVFAYGAYYVHQNYLERKSFIYDYDNNETIDEFDRRAIVEETIS